jgi:hypothetical protein
MDWPYKFPHPADVVAEEAERFRQLSPKERVRQIGEMVDLSDRLLAVSPRRDAVLAKIEADEQAWQEAQRRVFAHYGV